MINARVKKWKNICYLLILICLIAEILLIWSARYAPSLPSKGKIKPLLENMDSIESDLYQLLAIHDLSRRDLYEHIFTLEKEVKDLRNQADAIYDTIPEGTIIKRENPFHVMRPVGKMEEVEHKRELANNLENQIHDMSHKIAKERGGLVNNSEIRSLWEKYRELSSEINEWELADNDFSKTKRGIFYSIYKILLPLTMIVLIFIIGILVFVIQELNKDNA